VAESCYLRYPHAARDLVTFAAQDDVWLASLSEAAGGRGARAWRLTADQAPLLHARLNPSADSALLAWSQPTSSAPRTVPGGSRGSCPASRR
jgi:tricorn protease